MDGPQLTQSSISGAVNDLGWRLVLGTLHTGVRVGSWAEAAQLAAIVAGAGDADADTARRLRLDLRADRALLNLEGAHAARVGPDEITLAGQISAAVATAGWVTEPAEPGGPRSLQGIEFAIDTLDAAAIRPFWRAVLGYTEEPGLDGPDAPLVDPWGQGPALWFQDLDQARPQRNRIHLDISVPHDVASARVAAALATGGTLRSDARAPRFWVLADADGNEVCVTTWQGRDPDSPM
jgi:4a-hydroxytetrahydrobiopterin dehydratase